MHIADWPSAATMPQLYRELRDLGLETNIAELEAFGYTIVPPEKVGDADYHAAARAALLRVAGERAGAPVDLPGGASHRDMPHSLGQVLRFILWDDPLFEKIALNPAAFGLIQYLLGTNCLLSLFDASVKGPGKSRTGIHVDWADFTVQSFAPEPATANFNYLLTDYSQEEGALSFVPGSHRWRRFPSSEEAAYWADRAQPVEAPAGSMVVWGSHTWHGSFPRTAAGVRMMIVGTYCRPHLQTQEPFRDTCPPAALARNPARFAALMDQYGWFPIGTADIDQRRILDNPAGVTLAAGRYCSLFDAQPAGDSVSPRPDYDYARGSADYRADARLRRERAAQVTRLYGEGETA